ncbi:MAG: hypothetical protein KAJ19_19320, partial [Gammaproteobacteria bacterium]|nr:hypothetical protein [Gammaproteobacteria bacterium]
KFRSDDDDAYEQTFGRFGLRPQAAWPIPISGNGTYETRIDIQTETGFRNLAGATGPNANRQHDNRYCKTWHSYYRFQMACRTSQAFRATLWDMGRRRIRDILNKTFNIGEVARRTGDFATSEKAVSMLLRWHIFRPGHLFRTHTLEDPNYLQIILTTVIAAHPAANQARENAMIAEIDAVGSPLTDDAMATIRGWTDVPQMGTPSLTGQNSYNLNLANSVLSNTEKSFDFDPL